MTELPPELWLYISQFIPDSVLRSMLGVNALFYDISMDLRYKQIDLQTFNSRTMKLLSRLADPAVARRVEYFTVSPDFRFYGVPRAQTSHTIRDRFSNVLNSFRLANATPLVRPEEEGTKALINVLPGFSNVRALTIDSHSWGPHSSDIGTFLKTAWSSIGSRLKKLSLRGHASSFRTIIMSNPALPIVEELFLELIDNPLQSQRDEDADTLVTVLAPFINSLAPKLQAFTLWSWASADLSALFNDLGEFPLLTVLNLQTSFPRTFRTDSSSLSGFLQKHCSQIEILILRLNTIPLLHAISSEQHLSEWMLRIFTENRFSRLRELQLYPSALPEGFNALLACIQQSAETLTTLVVRERYLDPEEVLTLMDVLPPNLQSLRLNIRTLGVDFFDVATAKLPELRSLSLYVTYIAPTFSTDIESRFFKDWPLRNVGIWQSGPMVPIHFMHTIRRSIPSVQGYWSLGTMEIPDSVPDPVWSSRIVDDYIR